MTWKQRSRTPKHRTQKHRVMPGWARGGSVFTVLCVFCASLVGSGAAADPSPAAVSSKSVIADKAANAGPPRLFAEHGVFEGTITRQPGGSAQGTPQRRTQPLSLPPGTYRVLLDVQALTGPHSFSSASSSASSGNPSLPPCDAFLRLSPPEVSPTSQAPAVQGLSVAAQAVRFGGVIKLTTPFQGNVEYGAGGFGRQEAWFTIVPVQDTGFVPFGFGGVPEALPRGAAQAARKTLPAGRVGDVYFLRLPAGASRVSLEVRASAGTPLPPGASSGGMDGGFGAAVDVLDRWGVMTQETFLVARFGRGEAGRQASRKVLAGTGPEFIKLRVRLLGRLPVPAPRYVLTVEAADGQ